MPLIEPEINEINLRKNLIILKDGREYPLHPDIKLLYSYPVYGRIASDIREIYTDKSPRPKILPIYAKFNAFSKSFSTQNVVSTLLTDLFLDPAIATYGAINNSSETEGLTLIESVYGYYAFQRQGRQQAYEEMVTTFPGPARYGSLCAFAFSAWVVYFLVYTNIKNFKKLNLFRSLNWSAAFITLVIGSAVYALFY